MTRSASFTPSPSAASEFSPAVILVAPKTLARSFASGFIAGVTPVAANALIDTGAILALLDRGDRWHQACVAAFRQLRLPLLTSEAVLTELFHLVGGSRAEMEAAWKFVRSGAIILSAIEDTELPNVRSLMSRYWDRPIDFANATLVYLARRESLSAILTVDHADFATYRIEGKRQFRVLPAERP
jgi:predicted nucleic acid-binding protein